MYGQMDRLMDEPSTVHPSNDVGGTTITGKLHQNSLRNIGGDKYFY